MATNLKVSVDVDTGNLKKGMGEATQSMETFEREIQEINTGELPKLQKEMRKAKQTALNLGLEYSKLSDELKNSKHGQELKRQFDEAVQSAANLVDLSSDINEKIKNLSSDTKSLDALTDGFEVVGGAMTSYLSLIATASGKQEDFNRALSAFAAVQSTVNTVTKIANTLQPQSNLMIGIAAVQSTALAKAKALEAAATTKATIAQRAFNIAAKANPYVLLGMGAAALIGIMLGVSNAMKKSEEEIAQMKKEAEDAKQSMEDYINTVSGASLSFAETASRVSYLRTAYQEANSELAKTSILKQAQAEFRKLGLECKSLNDAQTLLVNQGAQVIEMIRLQGEAAAVSALRMEAFKKSFNTLLENGYDVEGASILAGYNSTVLALDKRAETLNQRITQLKSQLPMSENRSTTTRNTVKTTYTTDSLAALEHKLSELQSKYKNGLIKITPDDYKRQVENLERQINDKKVELGIEFPPTMESKLKTEIERLQRELAFTLEGSVDEAEIKRLISIYQQRLEKEQARLKIEPELEWTPQNEAELNRKVNDILSGINPDTYFDTDFDFSGLSDGMKTEANKTVDQMNRIKTAIESFKDMMNDPDASDRQIATVQRQIDELLPQYDKLKEKATEFNNASNEGIKWNKTMDNLKSSISNVGSAFSSLSQITEDETFNTAGIIAQAVANMSLSFAEAMKNHKSFTVWDWIAAGTMGLSQLLAMIASIKSAQGYATGGVVGGHSYQGDRLLARVNSGETIMTEKQAARTNAMLDAKATGIQNINIVGKIKGTDILLVAKNTNKMLAKSGTNISIG